jgi:hypothetical protein
MKQFIIYYSWSQDEHTTVDYYRTTARGEAQLTKKSVAIAETDTDQPLPSPNFYTGATIQCVTVDENGKLVDSAVNPTLQRVTEMIDNL